MIEVLAIVFILVIYDLISKSSNKNLIIISKALRLIFVVVSIIVAGLLIWAVIGYYLEGNRSVAFKLLLTGLFYIPAVIYLTIKAFRKK
ncbi:hypothetical protein [Peptoniphilus catoniae]|uniref:hypothetical protein n=1 Tax=Peptoniphilus catoniae TaxID=1660341 RepID=UPI0010FE5E87|nr:hypothetical protein [Peptoniphilus catoniae]